jgi:hypothetical protein
LLGIRCEFSSAFGDVHESEQSTEGGRRVPRGRHELQAEAGFRLVSVLCERDIARGIRLVFDTPVVAVVFEQSRGVGLFSREICDAVDDFGGRLAPARFAIASGSLACDAIRLSHARPTQSPQHDVQRGRGLDDPRFLPTVALDTRCDSGVQTDVVWLGSGRVVSPDYSWRASGERSISRFRRAPYFNGRRVNPRKRQKATVCSCSH